MCTRAILRHVRSLLAADGDEEKRIQHKEATWIYFVS